VIQKKICLIGSFAVGKTSLVSRYVRSIFSEKYHTTIGVKVDKKELTVGGKDLMLMIWDLAGDDRFGSLKLSYLRGAAGYLLVADGTRRSTLATAVALRERIVEIVGGVPFLLLVNKADLQADWEIAESDLKPLVDTGWRVLRTSALSGDGVESAFQLLSAAMLAQQ